MKKPAAKTRVVAKRHTHAKPAARGGHPAAGHAAKHHAAKKHHVAAKKHRGGTVKRGLALGEGVACCSAEALAASLRLAGAAVSDDDVLALHWLAGGDVDTGVSILAALEAASEFGLAGYRPASFVTIDFDRARGECMRLWRRGLSEELDSSWERERSPGSIPGPDVCAGSSVAERSLSDCLGTLLLGLELPGPHAVLAEPGRWWTWGEPYDPAAFPDAVIEEAWAVTWH